MHMIHGYSLREPKYTVHSIQVLVGSLRESKYTLHVVQGYKGKGSLKGLI